MTRRNVTIITIVILLICVVGATAVYLLYIRPQTNFTGVAGQGVVADVTVPPGFSVNVFAQGLNGPRFMAFGPDGRLYVADRGNNRIVALEDDNGDGQAETSTPFATDLNSPHSIVYHNDAWYVGVPSGVIRLQDTTGDGRADSRTTLVDSYPSGGLHTTRTVEFLPNGRMVVSIGSSCNVCTEDDPRRAGIVIYNDASGEGERIYATGLRNAVGLAVHPQTGQLWVTNNGRDFMGDDLPPDTVRAVEDGAFYGWPVCHSGDIVDPNMGEPGDCDDVPEPAVEIQAHSAPLGITFYTGDSFPEAYRGDAFIAYHGSWNRSVPTGYKVVRLSFDGAEPTSSVTDFATGWLKEDGSSDGRPVGLAVGPDGALYVSDDKGGYIYRIQYTGNG